MIETIIEFMLSKTAGYIGGSILAFILAWIFKKIDNEKISLVVEKIFYGLGVFITVGLSKWKYTAKIWNSTIEIWIIDLIDNIVGAAVRGFINGLRSDNE